MAPPDDHQIFSRLGLTIRRFRQFRNMNQGDLAREVGVSQSMISQLEKGQVGTNINLLNLIKIARVLGLTCHELIKMAEEPPSLEDLKPLLASLQA